MWHRHQPSVRPQRAAGLLAEMGKLTETLEIRTNGFPATWIA